MAVLWKIPSTATVTSGCCIGLDHHRSSFFFSATSKYLKDYLKRQGSHSQLGLLTVIRTFCVLENYHGREEARYKEETGCCWRWWDWQGRLHSCDGDFDARVTMVILFGQTCLLIVYAENRFPEVSVSAIFCSCADLINSSRPMYRLSSRTM
jgi:hypothetical protein